MKKHSLPRCLILVIASTVAFHGPAGRLQAVGDPPATGRVTRRTLEALTPAQLEAFLGGADAKNIVLDNGDTLARFVGRAAAEAAVGLAYTPVDPCVVLRTAGTTAGQLAAGKIRGFLARGNLGAQGGCGQWLRDPRRGAGAGGGRERRQWQGRRVAQDLAVG
jgi:hypothetical protein